MKEQGHKVKLSSFEGRIAPEVDRVRQEISELARGDEPVIAGPFTSEVGFELLYWIPMMRWAVSEFPSLKGRLVVLSRGGTAHWVSGLDARYVDVFEICSPDELIRRRESLKQREVTDFEQELLQRARERLGILHARMLHPQILFNFYYRVLKIERHGFARSVRREGDRVVGLVSLFQPLPEPPLGPLAGLLPDDYVTVRFYFRPSFPDTPDNRRFATEAIRSLAETTNVVLLNNSLELDDHRDFIAGQEDGLVTIDRLMRPDDNLHLQTIALSRARAHIGTYGGLAYLAPFLSVPSLSFSSEPRHTHLWHLDIAQRVFDGPEWAPIVAMRPQDLSLVELLTPALRSYRPSLPA